MHCNVSEQLKRCMNNTSNLHENALILFFFLFFGENSEIDIRQQQTNKNQHNKLDEDGGPEFGVNGCCTEDRLLVSPINDPLLKPVDIHFFFQSNQPTNA